MITIDKIGYVLISIHRRGQRSILYNFLWPFVLGFMVAMFLIGTYSLLLMTGLFPPEWNIMYELPRAR